MRTTAPKGQTPVLQYSFNWQQLSLIAGVTYWRFYFRFFPGAIKGPQIVDYLKAVKTTIHGRLLIIWDGLPAHRSRVVREYVESLDGHIQLERLPAYAPELNPVEYLFGYAKQRELANLSPPRAWTRRAPKRPSAPRPSRPVGSRLALQYGEVPQDAKNLHPIVSKRGLVSAPEYVVVPHRGAGHETASNAADQHSECLANVVALSGLDEDLLAQVLLVVLHPRVCDEQQPEDEKRHDRKNQDLHLRSPKSSLAVLLPGIHETLRIKHFTIDMQPAPGPSRTPCAKVCET